MKFKHSSLLVALLLASCGSDPAAAPTLAVDVYGWGPDYQGGVGFVQGLPGFVGGNGVQISVVQPLDGKVLGSEVFPVADGTGKVPEVSYGENLRLDFEVTNADGGVVASGASPLFDFDPDLDRLTFRIQVDEVNGFAPYGSIVKDGETGERRYAQSRFDYRATTANQWLGRIGHGVVSMADGTLVVVGGGDPVPGASVSALPDFRSVNSDVQTFEIRTGYFTDIAIDAASNSIVPGDKLFQPVVWPSVTPIGDDKFIVAGGFTLQGTSPLATDTIQILDMKAEAGSKITRLTKADGAFSQLKVARGRHQAVYRAIDNSVVVTGGLGIVGADDVLDTFEVIKLDTGEVQGPFALQSARVEHTATTMFDRSTVWVVGGRDKDGVLATTEIIKLDNTSIADAPLRQARFGHAAVRITPGLAGNLLMVVGGFTDLAGAATANYEVGGLGKGVFLTGTGWELSVPRGRPSVVELPTSNDLVVIGGRDGVTDRSGADRLKFVDLGATNPYVTESGGTMTEARYMASANLASNGKVILIGGIGPFSGEVVAVDSAMMYNAHDPVLAGVQILE